MGITWNCIMPLLSTLAALVILVHSAEEDYDMKQQGIQERNLQDNVYAEEPWRVLGLIGSDGYPNESQSPTGIEDSHKLESNDRTNRIRKPKRRPQTDIGTRLERKTRPQLEDYQSQGTELGDTYDILEQPRRRRKRPEMILGPEDSPRRLKRRRGHKRKRPVSAEMNDNNSVPSPDQPIVNKQEHLRHKTHDEHFKKDGLTIEEPELSYQSEQRKRFVESAEFDYNRYRDGNDKIPRRKKNGHLKDFNPKPTGFRALIPKVGNTNNQEIESKEDNDDNYETQTQKSVNSDEYNMNTGYTVGFTVPETAKSSDWEIRASTPNVDENPFDRKESDEERYKYHQQFAEFNPNATIESSVETAHDQDHVVNDKTKDANQVHVTDLKDILKRSNGTSLSELLQKHNLSLSDLLKGGRSVLSILNQPIKSSEEVTNKPDKDEDVTEEIIPLVKESAENVSKDDEDQIKETLPTATTQLIEIIEDYKNDDDKNQTTAELDEATATKATPKMLLNQLGRKKLRLRVPRRNMTLKFQASRDFISLETRRKALKNNLRLRLNKTENPSEIENVNVKSNQTEDLPRLKIILDVNQENEEYKGQDNIETTPVTPTTINYSSEESTTVSFVTETESIYTTTDLEDMITEASSTFSTTTTTQRPTIVPLARPRPTNNSDLRRLAMANRLKRKRMKQRTSTTESTLDDINQDFYSNANLVSASEFISQSVPSPKSTVYDTTLENVYITESSVATERSERRRTSTTRKEIKTTPAPPLFITTEEIAKFEIEQILNDTKTGERLSKILMERNMTFSELVEHRERGSSQVHLADIFHNASREPNPTEPFLSKSSIEPISKETYPLRAILEANLHDTTIKATPNEPYTQPPHTENIPVVMDFGNNVNENRENLGIMSILNNFKHDRDKALIQNTKPEVLQDDNRLKSGESNREGREFETNKEVTLNEIFSMMQRTFRNATDEISESFTKALSPNSTSISQPERSHEDEDVFITEELQHLGDTDSRMSSTNDKLEVTVFERRNEIGGRGLLDKIPGPTKSVTVITASILGLAMVLFLLTYAGFKWRQQSNQLKNKECLEENIPTPVFESRKSKKNCSIRSISPMLSSSNIYSLNTLDSQNDKDSHDYVMWDTHRTPFQ